MELGWGIGGEEAEAEADDDELDDENDCSPVDER